MTPLQARILPLVLCAGPQGIRRRDLQRATGAHPENIRRALNELRRHGVVRVGCSHATRWVAEVHAPSLAAQIAAEVERNRRNGWHSGKRDDMPERVVKRIAPKAPPANGVRSIFDLGSMLEAA